MDVKSEINHIQKILPIPPVKMAKATPAKEPIPIFDAKDINKVSNELIFLLSFDSFKVFNILLNLNCGNFSLKEK